MFLPLGEIRWYLKTINNPQLLQGCFSLNVALLGISSKEFHSSSEELKRYFVAIKLCEDLILYR
jgi:hypothetical protein